MSSELIQLTEKLLNYSGQILFHYEMGRANKVKYDFQSDVKPFVEEVDEVRKRWKILMWDWLQANGTKHLHPKQVETTSDHIEQLSIQSFFPETSKTRFLNSHRTVEYFLTELLAYLTNRKEMQ